MNIQTLLEESRKLKAKEIAIKEEMKQKKIAIQKEFSQSIDDKTKEEIIKNAEEILLKAKETKEILVSEFKKKMVENKANVLKAKEMLSLVNHVSNSTNGIGNGKVKNQITLENGMLSILREGFQEVSQNTNGDSKGLWQKELKAKLLSIGIDDGIARNVCYKASLLVKSNQ